ncbi:MAG: Type 1 glutamine amidotransferase-like domain-containing protein [bacterium]|nr:Type 1 glutamine amidotransferase-like domain-containing protein [bacterium]
MASENDFAEQVRNADIIFLAGGKTFRLVKKLSKFPDLERSFKNKIVVASSSGVYVLSKYFCTNFPPKLGKGLGILNIKTFCHYDQKTYGKWLKKLIAHKKSLPILTLPNYKWVVIYK